MNRYQGELLRIEKFDPDKTFTALYWDGASKSFYVKRFSFTVSDNTPQSFISDDPKSKLLELSDDRHPRFEVSWKTDDRQPEAVDAEEWIAKKGVSAKGKKCTSRPDAKGVRFIEPLIKEDDEEERQPEVPEGDYSGPEDADYSTDDDVPEEEPTLF